MQRRLVDRALNGAARNCLTTISSLLARKLSLLPRLAPLQNVKFQNGENRLGD
ncbi:hypothetical protein PC116_g30642 [Phytophthora cactorum]|nr:hypothetical protein PC116_g30642 [Phytophthora cactorum]